jgi:formate hydrogenlyase subunit 3/multisubunit Na+/H+ antiporter MnhD subunit
VKEAISFICLLFVFTVAIKIFPGGIEYEHRWWAYGINFDLIADKLSSFILLAITFFGLIITVYSSGFMKNKPRANQFYAYLSGVVGAASGSVLSNNLVLFLVFWGVVLILLYGLIYIGSENAHTAASRSLITLGISDFLLILGIVLAWQLSGTFTMSQIKLTVHDGLTAFTFVIFMAGAIAKAGSIPFHTWIPAAAEHAPLPVMALLPASIDKLLGIYFLTRIVLDMFVVTPGMNVVLMIIGSITIVVGVMLALIQHDLKKLLSYHAISQVGYMVLGIGTGTPVGIAGGLFHMLNNAVYKTCLFLCGGSVERKVGTTDLGKLGGLAKTMPVTFVTCFIAAMSISGVPPFNGFFSKWMVYQGVIETMGTVSREWGVIFLVSAMFGSALTLASFIKVIHSVFLGIAPADNHGNGGSGDVEFSMLLPVVILSAICVLFGVFAYPVALKHFIIPSVGPIGLSTWNPAVGAALLILGIVAGLFVYALTGARTARRPDIFIGGEIMPPEKIRVSGTYFYDSLSELNFVNRFYQLAACGVFDFYTWVTDSGKIVSYAVFYGVDRMVNGVWYMASRVAAILGRATGQIQGGLLSVYLAWSLAGLAILLLLFL